MRSAISVLIYLSSASAVLCSCGQAPNADGIHGALYRAGVPVQFESVHTRPSETERALGSPGVSSRLHIAGNTLMAVLGGEHPPAWDEQDMDAPDAAASLDYAALADEFAGLHFEPRYAEDRAQIAGMLEDGAHMPTTLPASPNERYADDGEEAGLHAWSGASGSGGKNDSDNVKNPFKNRGIRERHMHPEWEFKQELDLYSAHAFRTGYDHSGTVTWTYRRPLGSHADWQLLARQETCNHGACPRHREMKKYEHCGSDTIIAGWYAVDTECSGNWMSAHLCNDDTSLQLANAQGIWTGTHCPGTRRGIRPHCGRQWP